MIKIVKLVKPKKETVEMIERFPVEKGARKNPIKSGVIKRKNGEGKMAENIREIRDSKSTKARTNPRDEEPGGRPRNLLQVPAGKKRQRLSEGYGIR